MIKRNLQIILGVAAVLFAACSGKESETEKKVVEKFCEPDPPVWTYNSDSVELGTSDFLTFDIDRDYSELNEKVHTDPAKNNYVENTEFNDVVTISYNGEKASVTCSNNEDIKVSTQGAHVTVTANKKVDCRLSGSSSNGSLKVVGDKKVRITLNGLDLKNAQGSSIRCLSKNECYLVVDSASVLRDDSLYAEAAENEQQKGCVFTEGKLCISGLANLKIEAKGADAIHSDKSIFIRRGTKLDIESHGGDAVQAQKNIRIEGGMININSTARGCHGIVADSLVEIAGGRTVILSHTPGSKGQKNSRGIKCDSLISITNAIVRVKESSIGGKGIRSGHNILIKKSIVDVLTFGNDDKHTGSKNKGVKGIDEVRIDSARLRIRCVNGWNEGLESRKKIIINNSLVEVKAHDDAISIGEEGVADFEMNSGRLFAETQNDALDSNGTIHINGGLAFMISHAKGGRGFDCDFKEFRIAPDAILVGVGDITSPPTTNLLEHPACFVKRSQSDPKFCVTLDGKSDNLISFDTPTFRFPNAFGVLISLPEFVKGANCEFSRDGNVSKPVHTFHGLKLGGTITGKNVTLTHRFSKPFIKLGGVTQSAPAPKAPNP